MRRRSPLLLAALVLGCAPASEASSLRFNVGEHGAMFSVLAETSAAELDVELDWALEFENLRSQPCPIAVYRWTDFVDPNTVDAPSVSDPLAWPETFAGGELVETGVVEAHGTLTIGPNLVDDPAPSVYGQFLLATCPDGWFVVSVRSEAVADLGARTLTESLGLVLAKID